MNKKGTSLLSWTIILLCLTVGVAIQQNNGFDVNTFKSHLNWTEISIPVESSPDLGNALTSLINGLGDTIFFFLKWFAQIASENPNIPFKLLVYLTLFAIISPIIIIVIKLIIIIFLLVKEYLQNKKEKKELKTFRSKQNE